MPTLVYNPAILKSPVSGFQLHLPGEDLPSNRSYSIIHKPRNTGYLFPTHGTPDFVTTYVTFSEITGAFGYETLLDPGHRQTTTIFGEPVEIVGPPLLVLPGDWYLSFLNSGLISSAGYPIFRQGEVVPPISTNLEYAYLHTTQSVLTENFVGIPLYPVFLSDDIHILQFWGDEAIIGPTGKVLSMGVVPRMGLLGVGKRVAFTENLPYFYVFVPYAMPSIVYFEVWLGEGYAARPVEGDASYMEYNVPYDSAKDLLEELKVTVLAYVFTGSEGVTTAMVGDFLNAVSSLPTPYSDSLSFHFDNDTFLKAVQFGFQGVSDTLSEDVRTAYAYLVGTMILRGIVMSHPETGTYPASRLALFVDLNRDEITA